MNPSYNVEGFFLIKDYMPTPGASTLVLSTTASVHSCSRLRLRLGGWLFSGRLNAETSQYIYIFWLAVLRREKVDESWRNACGTWF